MLRTAGDTSYEYDSQGRMTVRSTRTLSGKVKTWRYIWNSEDRLISTTTPDGEIWRYSYDALGRRVGKQRLWTIGKLLDRRCSSGTA